MSAKAPPIMSLICGSFLTALSMLRRSSSSFRGSEKSPVKTSPAPRASSFRDSTRGRPSVANQKPT